ncbi:hypothetical protein [Demequina sp. NBRC 110055]|uniref:hypothetical protein n=1 Tax=Demequina sp. NBRC 110055 TaxID=1570344 RepID=UPI0011861CC7|nr:hypothetical protein [Demequina sp. NBRC 110055]
MGRSPAFYAGLAGQGMALAAMLVPIVLRLTEPLTDLVVASAVSTIVAMLASMGTQSLLPVVSDAEGAAATRVLMLGVLAAGPVAAGALGALGYDLPTCLAAGALCAAQTGYIGALAGLVRFERFADVGSLRVVYGAASLAAVAVAAVAWGSGLALILAAAVSFLAADAFAVSRTWPQWREVWGAARGSRSRAMADYVRLSYRATLAGVLDAISAQGSGLAVAGLGVLAPAWAVITRISGGMATVGHQLVAPSVEMEVAAVVRRGDVVSRAQVRRGWVLGAALGALTTVASVAAMAFSGAADGLTGGEVAVLMVGAAAFWGVTVAQTPVAKLLVMLGDQRGRLIWEAFRAAGVGAILLTMSGEGSVLALSALGVLAAIAYYALLSRRRTRVASRVVEGG